MSLLESLLETSSHAIFTLDRQGIITHINRQAKQRFGLFSRSPHPHGAGSLKPGDVVILADTSIGADDGGLTPEDLHCIGIREPRLRVGDQIVAVGQFQVPGSQAVYKFLPSQDTDRLQLAMEFRSHSILATIENKSVSVTVDGVIYAIDYFSSIGHMVILDGDTLEVKFWEEKGYTARKEAIRTLLSGAPYMAKQTGYEMRVEGYHFQDFFEGELFETHLAQVMEGSVEHYLDASYEVNGYELIASILPVEGTPVPEGVIVKFRNVEDLWDTIQERNNAIKSAERKYRQLEHGAAAGSPFATVPGWGSTSSSVHHYAYKLSQLDCSILITGESGTGKSFLAKAICQAQPRKGPVVTVDCSTISPTLFESEMFGYVGGAFTGANPKGKAGFFESADGGTIFLDEIGEIPLNIQAKLLHVIQNKVVCRVGSTQPIPVDVRILAATNRNLKDEVAAGRFRQDLYYRLSGFSLELPPLRSCPEDICFIINDLMEKIVEKYHASKKQLSGEAFSRLVSYRWPGNIRELENVLERAVALSESDIIYPEHIHLESEPAALSWKEQLKQEEVRILRQALLQCEGSRTKAMKLLGMSKTVFYGKLKEYHIE